MASTSKPAGLNKFEKTAWQYMRLSGLLLIPLALGHLAMVHIINSVYDIDLEFVRIRWDLLILRIYDAALLWFAGLHGMNGLRTVIDDYFHKPGLNRALKIANVVVFSFVFLIGTIALIGGVGQP